MQNQISIVDTVLLMQAKCDIIQNNDYLMKSQYNTYMFVAMFKFSHEHM